MKPPHEHRAESARAKERSETLDQRAERLLVQAAAALHDTMPIGRLVALARACEAVRLLGIAVAPAPLRTTAARLLDAPGEFDSDPE